MESSLTDFEKEPRLRPTLLTVLCILTFIGSSWTIIANVWSYSTAARSAKAFSTIMKRQDDSGTQSDTTVQKRKDEKHSIFEKKMMTSVSKIMTEENIRKNSTGAIISGLFTLVGAVLMWRLRRIGFYLYIAGVFIGLIVPFYLFGNNLLAVGMSVFSGFFGLVFIALYALNFKNFR
jgi:type III secretory pathway component EscR